MNLVVLHGRLAKDPEKRETTTGKAVVSLTVAVKNNKKTENGYGADFINCTAWEKTGLTIAQYFAKGDPISVTGFIQTRAYEDKEGNKRVATEVVINSFEFPCTKKGEGKSDAAKTSEPEQTSFFEKVDVKDNPFLNEKDDSLPF